MRLISITLLLLGTALPAAEPNAEAPRGSSKEQLEFFEKKVRPLLVEHCHTCHGPKQQNGALRLDSYAALLKGGETGPVVVPGKPDESELILAVSYDPSGYQMPPDGKLKTDEIAILSAWVKMGVPWPAEQTAGLPPSAAEPGIDLEERAKHWSFQPVGDFQPPAVNRPDWPRSPVDNFILARLEQGGLAPATPADKRTLLRRITFDLIGLPPTPQEIESFLADSSPNAYEQVVDRLLASPHYGERWGRHWLDLVRFAETLGHEFDYDISHAWPYRDYVTRALNDDVPYPQFVVEHIAGDLIPVPRRHPVEGTNESVIGTAFYWFSQGKHSPVDIRAEECDLIDNQLDVLGKTFLGLTIACTRCHDHKFDPITTKDYYAMAGFLQSSRRQFAAIDAPQNRQHLIREISQLKSQNHPLITDHLVHRLKQSIARLSLLLSKPGEETHPLESGRWKEYLGQTAAEQLDDPLHPWALLKDQTDEKQFALQREQLAEKRRQRVQAVSSALRASTLFEDFQGDSYENWFATGEAFGSRPSRGGEYQSAVGSAGRVERIVLPGMAHSGLVSGKLQGALRSRTFTIEKPFIDYRTARVGGLAKPGRADKQGQIHLIVDGFQIIKAPLYGGLSINVPRGEPLRWLRQDVRRFHGHRAYIEIVDEDDGSVIVDQIRFSDAALPPELSHRMVLERLLAPDSNSVAALAAAYRELFRSAVDSRQSQETSGSESAVAADELLNWLLRTGSILSAETADPSPAASAGGAVSPEMTEFAAQLRGLEVQIKPPLRTIAMTDGTGENENVLLRGNHKKPGDEVQRRFLEIFTKQSTAHAEKGSGRLRLAEQIAGAGNPLTARVIVNRLWQHHFGRGIVSTPDDFGKMGQPPTHPELLDFLATRMIRSGWSIKNMHRLLVLSSTYRMSSGLHDAHAQSIDPDNRLLHRMRVVRLEGEIIRDAMLAVSGRLDQRLYGASIPPHLTPFMEGRGRPKQSGPLDGAGRRSIYIRVRRNFLTPMFLAFDYPTPMTTMGRRGISNVPAQGLTMMNNPFVIGEAANWAERTLAQTNGSAETGIRRLYLTAFARPPSESELAAALEFLAEQGTEYQGPADPRAWADLCHVLFNVKEFVFVN